MATISLQDAKVGGFKTVTEATTLKVTDNGKTVLLDAAAGVTVTLPAL